MKAKGNYLYQLNFLAEVFQRGMCIGFCQTLLKDGTFHRQGWTETSHSRIPMIVAFPGHTVFMKQIKKVKR